MIHRGRRKASCTANNTKAPLLTEKTVKDLVAKHIFFSVTTDASNHGTFKVFPIINHSYTTERQTVHSGLNIFKALMKPH